VYGGPVRFDVPARRSVGTGPHRPTAVRRPQQQPAGLAAGELMDLRAGLVGESELLQELQRPPTGSRCGHAEVTSAEGEVVQHGERAVQGVGPGDDADAGLHADRVGAALVARDPRAFSAFGRFQDVLFFLPRVQEAEDGGGTSGQVLAEVPLRGEGRPQDVMLRGTGLEFGPLISAQSGEDTADGDTEGTSTRPRTLTSAIGVAPPRFQPAHSGVPTGC
jgi:hypothetical protein